MVGARAIPASADVEIVISRLRGAVEWVVSDDVGAIDVFDCDDVNTFNGIDEVGVVVSAFVAK